MGRFFSGFIYANFWIALLSTLFAAEYYLLQEVPLNYTVLTLVFFSTLFVYIVLRLKKAVLVTDSLHLQWIKSNAKALRIVAALSVVVIFSSYIQLMNIYSQLALGALGILSIWYGIPFFKKFPELRVVPFVKVFLIGIVYACVAVVVPCLEELNCVFSVERTLFFIAQLLYIIAITIPFDIRDSFLDKHAGIKTLPTYFDEKKAQTIAVLCLTIATLLLVKLVYVNWLSLIFLGGMYAYTVVAIRKTSAENSFLTTALLVEGSMVVHFLVFLSFAS